MPRGVYDRDAVKQKAASKRLFEKLNAPKEKEKKAKTRVAIAKAKTEAEIVRLAKEDALLGMRKFNEEIGVLEDQVNHPQHYGGDTTYETIKVIEAWGLNFNIGNTVKYLSRLGKKGDRLEQLEKALWYLLREIELEKSK